VVFGALSHPSRRQILMVLRARGGSVKAGDIARRFSCSWPTITRHLKQLEDAGLVIAERAGRERIYQLNQKRLLKVTGGWLAHFED
jgi:DNA-binding transcriptional ArsR family regulator